MFLYLFIPSPSVDTKLPLSKCTVIKALTVLPPEGSPHAPPKLWSSLCDTKHVLPGAGQQQSRCPTLANRLGPQHSSGNWDTQLCLAEGCSHGGSGFTVTKWLEWSVWHVCRGNVLQARGQGQHVPLGRVAGSSHPRPEMVQGTGPRLGLCEVLRQTGFYLHENRLQETIKM